MHHVTFLMALGYLVAYVGIGATLAVVVGVLDGEDDVAFMALVVCIWPAGILALCVAAPIALPAFGARWLVRFIQQRHAAGMHKDKTNTPK